MDRTDAFEIALAGLRERLREGAFAPGTRIPAAKVADDLDLSATPVREALSRLAGEGLVEERRQQGFFVRTLTGADVAALYRLSLAQLTIAQGLRSAVAAHASRSLGDDAVGDVEVLFLGWMEAGASACLLSLYRSLAIQLSPVRRIEPLVLGDLVGEARDLLALQAIGDPNARLAALRRFHARRVAVADRLASLVNRPDQSRNL